MYNNKIIQSNCIDFRHLKTHLNWTKKPLILLCQLRRLRLSTQVALIYAGCAYLRRLRLSTQVAHIKKPALSGSAAGHKKTRINAG